METETFIAETEDGGAVGLLVDQSDGSQVWSGPVSRDLFDNQAPEVKNSLGNDFGIFVVVAAKNDDPRIICRASGIDDGIDIARAIAAQRARWPTALGCRRYQSS